MQKARAVTGTLHAVWLTDDSRCRPTPVCKAPLRVSLQPVCSAARSDVPSSDECHPYDQALRMGTSGCGAAGGEARGGTGACEDEQGPEPRKRPHEVCILFMITVERVLTLLSYGIPLVTMIVTYSTFVSEIVAIQQY